LNVISKENLLRSQRQIAEIKEFESDPFQIHNLLSKDQVAELIDVYESSDKTVKDTGPVVSKIDYNNTVFREILTKLSTVLGEIDIRYAHFFEVDRPHVLHIDDDFDFPRSYKAITVPLRHDGHTNPKFYVYNQHYYGGPAKFLKDREIDPSVHYNVPVTDYNNIDGLDDIGIPADVRKGIDHLKDKWLEGLSVKAYFPWNVTSGIVFDSLQIHSAGNFKQQGVSKKLGLSIFTKDPK